MVHSNTHWHILGLGAIGSLWACALQAQSPRLLLSKRRLNKVHDSLTLTYQRDSKCEHYLLAVAKPREPIDNLLVCTKAYAVIPALQAQAEQINAHANIVLLGNGMGYHDEVLRLFPSANVYAATTTDGAWLKSQNHVVHAGFGETLIAPYSKDAPKVLPSYLQPTHLSIKLHNNANELLLQKLCINAAINGLSAIYDCRNGELKENVAAWQALQSLCAETCGILNAAGFDHIADGLLQRIEHVVQTTADNISSTCMDRRLKRRSEVAFFNGYLCTMAKRQGLDAPLNQSVINRVQAFEQNYD